MPQKVTIDGVETEVFSADEVTAKAEAQAKEIAETQLAAERETFEAEKLQLENERLEKEEELKQAQEDLAKAQNKDNNFANLRKSKEDADRIAAEQKKIVDDAANKVKDLQKTVDEIKNQPLIAAKNQFKNTNIGTDKNLDEKFEHYYDIYGKNAKTLEEVNAALIAAHAAATGGRAQPQTESQRITSVGVNDNYAGFEDSTKESDESKAFGSLLGLTPEDKKKFSPVLKTGSVGLFTNTHPMFKDK